MNKVKVQTQNIKEKATTLKRQRSRTGLEHKQVLKGNHAFTERNSNKNQKKKSKSTKPEWTKGKIDK